MNRAELIKEVVSYIPGSPEALTFPARFKELLQHPDAYQRNHLPGHLTGSAWIVNGHHTKVLLVLHGKLHRWMQPGGHADGDENILNVARREAEEETGIRKFRILKSSVFDFDIHTIPERLDFPQHFHYDVRFLLEASEEDPLVISDESSDLRWFEIGDVGAATGNALSIMRMVAKTRNL